MATAALIPPQAAGYLIGAVALAAVFLLRLRRLSRSRPLRLEQL